VPGEALEPDEQFRLAPDEQMIEQLTLSVRNIFERGAGPVLLLVVVVKRGGLCGTCVALSP
jgi:hypothetical protein